ncbi:hypothetical protein DCO58_08090 [Helicobacter saguini]|uniref:Uncharacterized protein n=1 Tax=Helicobacter saguini TaxID=1548018 RepID=A0A347VNL9_9HELI|nr:hypothetical protein [Helicobacter saguini]MWV61713.1 hypothetical protein [Helicobacter saguini]MWV67615.1 hypothetical protein [Helicobacter saguini]MWV69966.1 hypothetical protein [Helicobacter saguini]MWV72820.1 hypothetical protein [Helicobacter saguini]TLD92364.1 hypothetical protein LS64_010225 [Helicobacter saguini]
MFRIFFMLVFFSGVIFANAQPKCADKATLDELRVEFSKAVSNEFEEGMYAEMQDSEVSFLKESFNTKEGKAVIKSSENLFTNVKFNRILTEGNIGQKVLCKATLADFSVSRGTLEKIFIFIMIQAMEYEQKGASKNKEMLEAGKSMMKPFIDEAMDSLKELKGEDIHYSTQRSDDGYIVVEILDK